jgi:hypothetical protein
LDDEKADGTEKDEGLEDDEAEGLEDEAEGLEDEAEGLEDEAEALEENDFIARRECEGVCSKREKYSFLDGNSKSF